MPLNLLVLNTMPNMLLKVVIQVLSTISNLLFSLSVLYLNLGLLTHQLMAILIIMENCRSIITFLNKFVFTIMLAIF
jgi:hypothetical protein